MGDLHFEPSTVAAWGHAARHSGHDVRTAKHRVAAAEEDSAAAHATGMAVKPASDHYASGIESGVAAVATALTGTGDKLVDTVAVVHGTDNESADLFRRWGGPTA